MIAKKRAPRRASVLVCMLVCVTIATALVTATLQSALRARRELRLHRQLQQTELLLTAGLERAVARLSSDATYPGETWELDPATLPNYPPGCVTIEVTAAHTEDETSDRSGSHQIHVMARLSNGDPRGTQCSDTLTFDIPNPPTQE